MDLKEMYEEMDSDRKEFRKLLDSIDESRNLPVGEIMEFIKKCLRRCGSTFEEDCLKENLGEEYADWKICRDI